jgi:hypothetical protein
LREYIHQKTPMQYEPLMEEITCGCTPNIGYGSTYDLYQ